MPSGIYPRKTLRERFWNNVNKTKQCWLWRGYIMPNGYGQIRYRDRMYLTHRVSWLIHYGQIPRSLDVLHHCDIRNCVNPKHLWLGTHEDNLKDAAKKGRMRSGDNHPFHLYPELSAKGETCASHVLSNQQVINIRSIYGSSQISFNKLAYRFNVCRQTIANIIQRKTWKHL